MTNDETQAANAEPETVDTTVAAPNETLSNAEALSEPSQPTEPEGAEINADTATANLFEGVAENAPNEYTHIFAGNQEEPINPHDAKFYAEGLLRCLEATKYLTPDMENLKNIMQRAVVRI